MNVKKCDRCGAIYDPKHNHYGFLYSGNKRTGDFEICPICYNGLLDYLKPIDSVVDEAKAVQVG